MSNQSQRIISAKTFEADKVSYRPPVVNKRGGKSVQVSYEEDALRIQFPLMLTWGVNERVDEQSGRISYDMALQFEPEKSSTQARWLGQMKALEDKVKTDIMKNSKDWLGKQHKNRDVIDALFYPILKYPKLKDGSGEADYSRNPTLKLKVPFWEGRYNVEVYDMEQKALYIPPKQGQTGNRAQDQQDESSPADFVPKAAHCVGILQCTGLWFAGGKCGVTWAIKQMCVRPPQRLVGMGKCAIVMDSDDEEMESTLKEKEVKAQDDEENDEEEEFAAPSFTIEESDEEEDDEDEEEEEEVEEVAEVAPPPKKKKKVVRRKKKGATVEA
jgi:hypothetical protein